MNLRQCAALPLLCGVLAFSGCSSHHHQAQRDVQQPGLIYSPNAEPLTGGPLGQAKCDIALSRWFDRVDANHDGLLSHEEFLADAKQQFARMDIDHSGVLTPANLSIYRQPFMDMPANAPYLTEDEQKTDSPPSSEHRHLHHTGTLWFGTDVDPVMSADTTLSFRVSYDAFIKQAEESFARLDRSHQRNLSRDDIQTLCPPPPEE